MYLFITVSVEYIFFLILSLLKNIIYFRINFKLISTNIILNLLF